MFTWADMFEPFLDRDTDSFLVTALISSNIRSKMSTVEQVQNEFLWVKSKWKSSSYSTTT
jgi:hypothetical protein